MKKDEKVMLKDEVVIDLNNQIESFVSVSVSRINSRRASVGMGDIDEKEIANRVKTYLEWNDQASDLWYSDALVENRKREKEAYSGVVMYSWDCIDGRIGRAKKGATSGLKTDHAQASLYRTLSTGALIPSDINVQKSLEDKLRTPLMITRVHNHHCAAWALTMNNLSSEIWNYITPDEKKYVMQVSRECAELGNAIFEELTNRRAFDNYYQQAQKLETRKRIGVTVIYDLYTTGIELVTPLVFFDADGNTTGFPTEQDRKRLSTKTFVEAFKELQAKIADSNVLPAGIYKDNYFQTEIFTQFTTDLTGLSLAIFTGKLEKSDKTWIVPDAFIQLRVNMIDNFIKNNYQDLPAESQQALIYKFVNAAMREYLLEGQEHTHNHQEIHASVSSDGSNVGKYAAWYQTIRLNVPDPITGGKRITVGSAVMDKNQIDGDKPHIFFVVGKTAALCRSLFGQLVVTRGIEDLITTGKIFFVGVVLDGRGKVIDIPHENALII